MPNWVYNEVRIAGDRGLLEEVRVFLRGDEGEFDFNKLIPEPKELLQFDSPLGRDEVIKYVATHISLKNAPFPESDLEEAKQALSNVRKYGARDWYDWRCDHWGTKWNTANAYSDFVNGELVYHFETAWSLAEPILQALFNKYPNLEFVWEFHEENECTYLDEDCEEWTETWHIVQSCDISPSDLEDGSDRPYIVTDVERSGCD